MKSTGINADAEHATVSAVRFTPEQAEIVKRAIEKMRELNEDPTIDEATALVAICEDYLF